MSILKQFSLALQVLGLDQFCHIHEVTLLSMFCSFLKTFMTYTKIKTFHFKIPVWCDGWADKHRGAKGRHRPWLRQRDWQKVFEI